MSNARIVVGMPTWARVAIGVCAVYVAVNFVWFMVGHDDKVRVTDGKAIVYAAGVPRVLSDGEYRGYREWQVRMWSGHALIFYLVLAFYFLCGPGAKGRHERTHEA